MNVIFTCGGTGGHINPAIAVANTWKQRHPDSRILFIGAKGRMEERLVPQAGYDLRTIPASGISRGKNIQALKHNLQSIGYVLQSVSACKKIISEFKADVVVGTGGYASFPALLAASLLGVPICVHEANAMPGLTTRMIARRAEKVLVCFSESAKYYRHPERVEVVGLPVRKEFIFTRREAARKELSLDERPLIVSAFGSQGAKTMNEVMADLFVLEQKAGYQYQHIHATGSYGSSWMWDYVLKKGVDLSENKGISMQEYIYNMPTVMAAADVIISRAGSSSCNELAACGTPCILIPSPNVTDNHQEKNARALADVGAAILMLEKDCTAEALMEQIAALLQDVSSREKMSKALQKMCVPDSAERVCDVIEALGNKE